MRRYDDPVEVRKGLVGDGTSEWEGPEQFLWRGKLWKVRAVLAHWVETGAWWQSAGARAVIGSDDTGEDRTAGGGTTGGSGGSGGLGADLLTERELWRVEAAAGMRGAGLSPVGGGDDAPGPGVFDLSFDWADGTWQLVGCLD